MLSWLINHVNLDNENTLSSSSNAVFEYLILGVPQAYKVHIISSKGINTVALRNTGNFPKDTESHGSVPHVCSSQMHACVVSPCCSQRCIIVLWLRTAYVKTEWFLFWIRWSKHILIYRLIFKKTDASPDKYHITSLPDYIGQLFLFMDLVKVKISILPLVNTLL